MLLCCDHPCLPDKSVDLDCVNVVELLESLFDLPLVCLDINDEHKGVVLLNHLHGTLGVERVYDDLAGIESWLRNNRLARVTWCSRKCEGLWSVEGGVQSDLANFVRVDL